MGSGVDAIGGGSSATRVRAMLDAWRACGADRVNPARFRFIDALERRTAGLDGDVRRVLDERLAMLIADYSGEVERAKAQAEADGRAVAVKSEPARNGPTATLSTPARNALPPGALAELVDLLTHRATAINENNGSVTRDARDPQSRQRGHSPDVPVLDYFRDTWAKFSTEKQLRHSLEQVPDNAGPLNSNSLIHRSLSLMRELSPGYLQQFLSYVEALSWMEQLAGPVPGTGTGAPVASAASAASAAAAPEATRTGTGKKGVRGKAKERSR